MIPTLNGRRWIARLLEACLRQQVDFTYEILVIDSGSSDGTAEALREFPTVRTHSIRQPEFGHGRTRNLAVRLARGEFVVFLTQDALPASDHWLSEIMRPFRISDQVACVLGKQVPQPDCCPAVKRDVISLFASFGPDQSTMLQHRDCNITDQAALDAMSFLSDVNAAYRRSVLLEIPFRDVEYAEDQAFGRDVLAAGYYKAYAPLGAVVHSHSYPPVGYFCRMYEEMKGLRDATGQSLETDIGEHFKIAVKDTVKDWIFILRDRAYPRRTKVRWLLQAPLYNLGRRLAIRLSARPQLPRWTGDLLGTHRKHKHFGQS